MAGQQYRPEDAARYKAWVDISSAPERTDVAVLRLLRNPEPGQLVDVVKTLRRGGLLGIIADVSPAIAASEDPTGILVNVLHQTFGPWHYAIIGSVNPAEETKKYSNFRTRFKTTIAQAAAGIAHTAPSGEGLSELVGHYPNRTGDQLINYNLVGEPIRVN